TDMQRQGDVSTIQDAERYVSHLLDGASTQRPWAPAAAAADPAALRRPAHADRRSPRRAGTYVTSRDDSRGVATRVGGLLVGVHVENQSARGGRPVRGLGRPSAMIASIARSRCGARPRSVLPEPRNISWAAIRQPNAAAASAREAGSSGGYGVLVAAARSMRTSLALTWASCKVRR